MKFKNLLVWDIRFQARYGFYLLYTFLTILYVLLLVSLPDSWKDKASALLIFSDPAAMGLFFMGAIVLLEKSQRVTSFFTITPLNAFEYVASKVLSLSAIAMLVAAVLGFVSNCKSVLSVLSGTFLSSVIFTLSGLIIATKITSLNQFILTTVPVEILGFVPAILHLFGVTPSMLGMYPTNTCVDLIAGKDFSIAGLFLIFALIAVLFFFACRSVSKMWQEQGGVKL